jgi:hypothetical protein
MRTAPPGSTGQVGLGGSQRCRKMCDQLDMQEPVAAFLLLCAPVVKIKKKY